MIDTSQVQQALMARMQENAPTPALQQQSAPGGSLPTGGFNTPTLPAPASPKMPDKNVMPRTAGPQDPTKKTANNTMKAAMNMLGGEFDPESQSVAKALITNLLKYY
jgi:hypothetical protein